VEKIPSPFAGPRLIKCYSNRKLYDTVECRYVNLEDVADIIAKGAEVKVVEHRTSRDLTRSTLVKIIFQQERKVSKLDESALQALIRGAGGLPLSPLACAGRDANDGAEATRVAAEQRLGVFVERGERASDRAKEMLTTAHAGIADLQRRLNERVGAAWSVVADLGKVNRELRHLCVRIEELDERLRSLRAGPTPLPRVGEQGHALLARRC
jgi:polyhydroxyalkanoate synthesis repressor PhaR